MRSDQREVILWAIGMPLAVIAATLTLLALLSAAVGVQHGNRDILLGLVLVGGFGVPSALIARTLRKRRPARVVYYVVCGTLAGFIGLALLAAVLMWAEGRQDAAALLAQMTWSKAARAAHLASTIAWPGALAGFIGGGIFGAFANWADSRGVPGPGR
jgi:hypothetical protein